jgi:hypothetical protein
MILKNKIKKLKKDIQENKKNPIISLKAIKKKSLQLLNSDNKEGGRDKNQQLFLKMMKIVLNILPKKDSLLQQLFQISKRKQIHW